MDEKKIIDCCNQSMLKAIEAFKKELSSLRTGRPSPDILNPIKIEAYGSKSLISEVANISVPDPKTLLINVWDKSLVSKVEVAIRDSGLGFNPVVEGQILKIYLPPLTKERRDELAKISAKYSEKFKVEIRNIRREAMEELKLHKKDSGVSEDDLRLLNKKIEDCTNNHIKEVDIILNSKIKDLEQV